jgi:hypothetical protein
MKTAIPIILLSATVFAVACTTNKATTTQVVVMNDVTDQFLSRPVANEILSLYGFNQNPNSGGVFQFSDLTKVSFNETQVVKVEKVNQWLSNQFQRQQQIDTFQQGVSNIIAQGNQAPTGENNSSIYFPVANALNALAQVNADKKFLLIYSDMMENTPQISFYSKAIMDLMQTKPEAIQSLLEGQVKLQSLSGITIYLLYEPMDSSQDAAFKIISRFYQNFFESKGATVIIAPNLQD